LFFISLRLLGMYYNVGPGR